MTAAAATMAWPADQTARRPLIELIPYARNARTHSPRQIDQIAASMREWGWTCPVLVDEQGTIIAGHARIEAARKLGWTEAPVMVARGWSEAKKKAYVLADNRLAEQAEWDIDLLKLELADLSGMDFDLDLIGFDEDELEAYLAGELQVEGLTDEDAVPEPLPDATTRRGDLWILGEHRLLCGDSVSPEDVDRLVERQPVHLINTDPPYNVKVEPRSNNAIAAGLSSFAAPKSAIDASDARGMHHQGFDLARDKTKAKGTTRVMRPKDRPLENDFVSEEAFEQMLLAWFGNMARVLDPGRSFYIWGGYANCANYPPALRASKLYFSQAVIWVKGHPVLTRKDFMGNHEWCFYGWKEGAGHEFFGPTNVTDVWEVKKVNPQSMVHLTEKPVELAARAILYSSRKRERVLDLFGGSGSTLIACEKTGRAARLMELDPHYSDVIIRRWQEFTGKEAVREADGVNFNQAESSSAISP